MSDDEPLPSTVQYPFQIRPGVFAFLRLPADLTADDIERLCAFIKTLERP